MFIILRQLNYALIYNWKYSYIYSQEACIEIPMDEPLMGSSSKADTLIPMAESRCFKKKISCSQANADYCHRRQTWLDLVWKRLNRNWIWKHRIGDSNLANKASYLFFGLWRRRRRSRLRSCSFIWLTATSSLKLFSFL